MRGTMDNSVIIKGNKHGITVMLDAAMDFEKLKEQVAEKFSDSAKFLGSAPIVLGFEGRPLLPEQEKELLNVITGNCDLKVVCLVDTNKERENEYEKTLNEKLMDLSGASGVYYKGILRSGQSVTFESSVTILGDVNPGGSVIAKGNIIVMGSLRGQAFAGAGGNKDSFIAALDMSPVQIRIADFMARSPDEPVQNASKETMIAFLEDDQICIEPVGKSVWNSIRINSVEIERKQD